MVLTVRSINGCPGDTLSLDLAGTNYTRMGSDLYLDDRRIGRVTGGAGTALRLSLAGAADRHAERLLERVRYANVSPGAPYSRLFLLTTTAPGRAAATMRRQAVNSAWLAMLAEQVAAALGDLAARGEATVDRSGRLRALAPAVLPADSNAEPEALNAALELVLAARNPRAPAPASSEAARLSPRQCEVLQLVASGCSNKRIALELGVSPATIKTHVASAIATIGARNRTDAAIRARERGWI
ncbi:MAG: degU 1 [Sphingomonas bacterium]|uniref:helix-turn-helix transcriptional regulator n=1 Tax=Sphingomonas bacterium TaxID=1895847 RepID=UPI0026381B8A|nr:response regulator transcription factor [Sphingomonas bacterium]MDB5696481.1 degU 1 [Sphingomonas bacterium]